MSRHPATTLSVGKLRRDGWPLVEVVEHRAHGGILRDLFGFIDIVAVGPQGTLGIQATSVGGVSDRLRKIRTERADRLVAVVAAGWEVRIWGWHQPNGPRTRWELKRDVDLSTLIPTKETTT